MWLSESQIKNIISFKNIMIVFGCVTVLLLVSTEFYAINQLIGIMLP